MLLFEFKITSDDLVPKARVEWSTKEDDYVIVLQDGITMKEFETMVERIKEITGKYR